MFGTKFKKGVSPLIATILLIAFAVALGSVVINWGLNFSLGKSGDKCANVAIKIKEISSAGACYGGVGQNGYINFIIGSAGNTDISGLAILIVGSSGKSRLFDLDNILIKKGDWLEKNDKEVSYDFLQFGNINQVQFIPKIKSGQSTDICSKNSLSAEKISACI